jgi:hypothetical protein
MSDINLNDYYSAGYFLIRKNKRPWWLAEPEDLVPDELISLQAQFCTKFHLSWAWKLEDRTPALNFGINELLWDEFEQWCLDHRENIDVWSMFHSTEAIRRFIKQFIPESKWDGLIIVGVGLHQSCEVNWREPNPEGTEGVEVRISGLFPMEEGGNILGFEIASYVYHNFDHTWFSHLHHRGVFQEHNIRPGAYGLLQTREQAEIACTYTNEHDKYVYDYWLLVSYPLFEA